MTPWKRKEVIGGVEWNGRLIGFTASVSIYALEFAGVVRYVGSTTQPIKHRLRAHIITAQAGSDLPVHIWMRENTFSFDVRLLDTVPPSERVESEKRWVSDMGPDLLNVTDGGQGMSGNKFAGTIHAERIAAKLRTGSDCVCETCSAIFWRKLRDIKLGHIRFCSRRCYQAWQRGRAKLKKAVA